MQRDNKKNYGVFCKNSTQKGIVFMVLTIIIGIGTSFSNHLLAQPPTGYVNIIGPTVICESSSSTIDFVATSGNPPFTFVYSVNGAAATSVTSLPGNYDYAVTHPAGSMPATYTYTLLSIQDANTGPTPQTSAQVLTVQPLPKAIAGGTSTTICADGGIANVSGSATDGTINWTKGNGRGTINNPGSPTPTYTADIRDAGKVIALNMTVTSNNVCATQPPAVDKYYVPVYQAMTASFSISSPATCLNSPDSKISFYAGNGTPPYTFTYSENGGNNFISTVGTNTLAVLGGITSAVNSYTYALVSIQDANCSQAIDGVDSQTLTVNPLPEVSLVGNPRACQDDPFPFIQVIGYGGVSPYTVLLSINGRDTTISLNQTGRLMDSLKYPQSTSIPGIYTYSLVSVHDNSFGTAPSGEYRGCNGTINTKVSIATIDERPYPYFSVVPERVSSLDPTINVKDASVAATNWFWDFGDSTVSPFANPGPHTYKDTGTYTIKLKVSTNVACSNTTSQNVRVYLPFTLYVPSAFSPNNDGVNDVFLPKGDGITLSEYSMAVYDRWGGQMFYTTDINEGWNGKVKSGTDIVKIDAYVYVINLVADEDGKTYIYYGTVTSTLR